MYPTHDPQFVNGWPTTCPCDGIDPRVAQPIEGKSTFPHFIAWFRKIPRWGLPNWVTLEGYECRYCHVLFRVDGMREE